MTKTRWQAEQWMTIEALSNALLSTAHDLSERVGSGGGDVDADDIRRAVSEAKSTLALLIATVGDRT